MRERIKKFIALVMTIVLLNQMPGFDILVAQAAPIYIDTSTTVSTDTEDTYVFSSGGCTLSVESGVTVAGVEIAGYNIYTVENSGTVSDVMVSSGEVNLNGGNYGIITITEEAMVNGGSINAGIIASNGTLNLDGENIVTDSLTAQGIGGTGIVNVGKDTTINAISEDLIVYYNDTEYTIAGGTMETSVAKEYGVLVTFQTTDENIDWTAASETDNLNTYLMPGETTGTYICTAVEGYYFPEGYSLTYDGYAAGTLTAIRQDESTLTVSYTVSENDIELDILTITFPALSKILLDGSGTLNIANVSYGETIEPVVSSDTHTQNGEVVEYKLADADDSDYDVSVPTAVGNYEARIILPANEIYKELELKTTFSIEKAEGTGTFNVEDITYGDTVKPQVSSDTYDVDSATVQYKEAEADDTTYATDIPTEVGNYIARVIFAANDSYNQLVLTDEFVIEAVPEDETADTPEDETADTPEDETADTPEDESSTEDEASLQDGTGTLDIADAYYGTTVNPQITSSTNSVVGVTVEYKSYDASDATYSTKVPAAIGTYMARVTLSANDKYKEVVLTDQFVIDYLPLPTNSYFLVGETGANGYYTSEVMIVAKDGYSISTSLNGEYTERITINSSKDAMTVYFMDENTGAKTKGILISAINIDVDAPNVDVNSNNIYYADSLAVSISDNNLASISLNGEVVDIDGNNTILDLKSNGGIEEYKIVVTDLAGHTREMIVTVAAEWTKTGEIPSGSQVKLQAGKSYTLGSGIWTVSGDTTSYNGNATFYVGGEGQYTFNQQ